MAKITGAITLLGTILSIIFLVPPLFETQYRCWDRSLEPSRRDCPAPSGSAGLLWFYPSLESAQEQCEYRPPALAGKRAVWVCPFVRDDFEGLIRYSAWPDPHAAGNYYRTQFGAPGRIQHLGGEGVGFQWVSSNYPSKEGYRYKRAGSFYTAKFSWTVAASTLAGLDHGTSRIEIRDVDHWKYVRTETALSRFLQSLSG